MDNTSDLTKVARLLAEEPTKRFLVVTFELDGTRLAEVESIEAPSESSAMLQGEAAAANYPNVFVICQIEDHLGVVRTSILHMFEHTSH